MDAAIRPNHEFYQDTKINPKLVRKSIYIEKIIKDKNNKLNKVFEEANPYINSFDKVQDDSLYESNFNINDRDGVEVG